MRVLRAALLVCVVACSSSTGGSSGGSGSVILPPGIAAFKNASAAVDAGVYPGNQKACCFLGPTARLILNKPAGKLVAIFNFYVPKMEPDASSQTITVAATGTSATGSLMGAVGRRIVVSLEFPAAYQNRTMVPVTIAASKSFVPSEIGMNGDTRRLSVMLIKVEYR